MLSPVGFLFTLVYLSCFSLTFTVNAVVEIIRKLLKVVISPVSCHFCLVFLAHSRWKKWIFSLSIKNAIFWCVLNKLKWYLFLQFGHTPLHLAAEKGNLMAVKALVRNPNSPADYSKQNKVSVSL